ncbi:MAG TPA: hypothetical protein VMW87_16510 [Spirochaetia bacterium]|nr:hypothetical protein [Spirochaetia bacterium]
MNVNGNRIAGACLLAGLLACQSVEAQNGGTSLFRGVETGVSRLYFDSARTLFDAGKEGEAESLVRIALEYDPADADAHYLLGRILLSDQGRTTEAELELKHAVQLNDFRVYLQSDCALALAALYLRTGRYLDGISTLQHYGGRGYVDQVPFHNRPIRTGPVSSSDSRDETVRGAVQTLAGDADPRYTVVLVKLLEGAGEAAQAQSILQRGLLRYPGNTDIEHLFLMRDPVPALATSSWLDAHASRDPAYLNFLTDYIRALPDGSVRKHFIDLYFHNNGNSPEAWALSAGSTNTDTEALKGFLAAGATTDRSASSDIGAIQLIYSRLKDLNVKRDLENRLAAYSGTLGLDSNHDGYYEQTYHFDNGRLVTWTVDNNQDGVPSEVVHLAPAIVSVDRSSRSRGLQDPPVTSRYTVTFGEYPRVGSVRFERSTLFSGEDVEYLVIPGKISLPVTTPPASAGGYGVLDIPMINPERTIITETEVRSSAFRALFRSGSSGRISRVLFLDAGVPYLAAIDNTGRGIVDEVVEYRGGKPLIGVRDLNGDGFFEETEFYTAGSVSYLAVDDNHDGMPEYFQQILPTESYAWDLNGDGRVDAKDVVIGRNEVTRLFSSRMNGTLDLALNTRRFMLPASEGKAP